jgi:hypothetical protein
LIVTSPFEMRDQEMSKSPDSKTILAGARRRPALLPQNHRYSNSNSKRSLRWLVEGSSTYYLYASVAFFLAALISSLI